MKFILALCTIAGLGLALPTVPPQAVRNFVIRTPSMNYTNAMQTYQEVERSISEALPETVGSATENIANGLESSTGSLSGAV